MRPILRLCSVCALTACVVGPLHALQSPAAQIRGVVTDAANGAPLAGAEVRDIQTARHDVTDHAGLFELTLPEAGTCMIEISRSGFESVVLQLDARAGRTLSIPGPLLALERTANGFHERRAQGRGVFVDRQNLEEWRADRMTDALRHVSGVKIRPVSNGGYAVTMRHGRAECSPIAFLDGAYLGHIDEFDLDATIPTHAVEAIEVYRGLSEIPQRFDAMGAQCGVLAFWTR